ncbi:MAG: hypothetical protein IBJ09_12665 [Bacteroidia bacterium]|nr:hypothetical protein [Bacteroidia bacterium]
MYMYSGYFEENDSGYLFLANLLVHDSIHFYTYPGLEKRRVIPLKKVKDLGYELYNIQVASLDSVMLMGRYHNILFTVDDKGNIVNERDLVSLCDADSFYIDLDLLRGGNQNIFTFEGKPYLLLNASNSSIKPYPSGSLEDAFRYYGSPYTDPMLALYSLTEHTLRLDSLALFRPLNPEGKLMTVHGFYAYTRFRDKALILSHYSDTLYVVNPEHLHLERKIPLRYSSTERLSIETYPITEKNRENASNLFTEAFRRGNYVSHVFSDFRGEYAFVAVIPPRTEKQTEEKVYNGLRYLVFDHNLEQIDEEHFFNRTTNAGFVIPVSNGMLFSLNTPNNPNFSETKARFALYRYE